MRSMQVLKMIGLLSSLWLAATSAHAQEIWYVDDDASHDPGPGDPTISDLLEDGTLARPYDAIQEAIDAASVGAEVVVLDGVYTRAGNKDIRFFGKEIYLHSQHGPETCVIDLQGLGFGFLFGSQDTEVAILDGFTIQNGGSGAGWEQLSRPPGHN